VHFSFSWTDLRPGEITITIFYCRRPPVLRSSGMLRSFDWKPVGHVLKESICLTLADGTDRLSRKSWTDFQSKLRNIQ